MPSQRQVTKNIDIDTAISKAARRLKFYLKLCRESVRIPARARTDRDLLIYLVWQSGAAANPQIGEKFGLACSAVGRRVSGIKMEIKIESWQNDSGRLSQ